MQAKSVANVPPCKCFIFLVTVTVGKSVFFKTVVLVCYVTEKETRRKLRLLNKQFCCLCSDPVPLHMSPVGRAGPVTETSPHSYFLGKNFDVFI